MKQNYLLQLATFLLLSACTTYIEEKESLSDLPDTGNTLHILSVQTENTSGNTSKSRSITTSVQADGDRLGIFAVNTTDLSAYTPSDGINPAAYTYQSGTWGVADPADQLRLSKTGSLEVYAWHPVADGLVPVYQSEGRSYLSGINILSRDDFRATGQTDYLYPAATARVDLSSRSATFTLKHALAKLTLKIKKNTSVSETMTLTKIVLKSSNDGFLAGSGSNRRMSLSDGKLAGLLAAESVTLNGSMELTTDGNGSQAICLVAPVSNLQRLAFELTVEVESGADVRIYQSKGLTNVTSWTTGKHYVYSVMIDKMSAEVEGSPEIYDWVEEINDIPIQ